MGRACLHAGHSTWISKWHMCKLISLLLLNWNEYVSDRLVFIRESSVQMHFGSLFLFTFLLVLALWICYLACKISLLTGYFLKIWTPICENLVLNGAQSRLNRIFFRFKRSWSLFKTGFWNHIIEYRC